MYEYVCVKKIATQIEHNEISMMRDIIFYVFFVQFDTKDYGYFLQECLIMFVYYTFYYPKKSSPLLASCHFIIYS